MACFDFVVVLLNYKHWEKNKQTTYSVRKAKTGCSEPFLLFLTLNFTSALFNSSLTERAHRLVVPRLSLQVDWPSWMTKGFYENVRERGIKSDDSEL